MEKFKPQNKILDKALERSGSESMFENLKDMKREDLTTLLISLFEERAKEITPDKLSKQYETDRFLRPSSVSQLDFLRADAGFLMNITDDIQSIELSPLAPLGSNSVLAQINQKNILGTTRSTEVMADTVTTLALECAQQRKLGSEAVYICTSHRETRAQQFDPSTGFTPHFRAISLVSSESIANDEQKISKTLEKHLDFYLSGLSELKNNKVVKFNNLSVRISSLRLLESLIRNLGIERGELMKNTGNREYDLLKNNNIALPNTLAAGELTESEALSAYKITPIVSYMKRIGDSVFEQLAYKFPEATFEYDLSRFEGLGYYEDICFKIKAQNENGEVYPLADGGFTDWTSKLLYDRKEKCFSGGLGTELLLKKFKST